MSDDRSQGNSDNQLSIRASEQAQVNAIANLHAETVNFADSRKESYAPRELRFLGIMESPPNVERYWVERVEVQAQLKASLKDHPVTEIIAVGGFGKSSLAAWACDQLKEPLKFKNCWWVNFRRGHTFYQFAGSILQELGFKLTDPQVLEESLLREIVRRLNETRTLLVMDQVETLKSTADWGWFEQFLLTWVEQGRLSRVLVTTKSRSVTREPLALGGMTVAEGTALLQRQGLEGDCFAEMITLAEGHPLLLKLAAAWVRQTEGAKVDTGAIDFFRRLFGQYQADPTAKVEDVFETLFDAVPEGLQDLLLRVSVYRLPFNLEMAQAMQDSLPTLQREIEAQYGFDFGNLATSVMEQSLQGLVERGLLSPEGNRFTLHPLVVTFVQNKLRNSALERESHERAIAYYEAHAQEWDGTVESCQEILEAAYHSCELGNYVQADRILNRCKNSLQLAGQWRVLLPLYERLTQEWKWANQTEARSLAWAWNTLGVLHIELGYYSQTLTAYQKALKIHQATGNREGEGGSLCNIGHIYYRLGEYQQALDYYNQALPVQQEVRNRHFEANTLGGLGNTHYSLGQYKEATEFHQQALAIGLEINSHKIKGIAIENLGNVYEKLAQYEKAIEYRQQALEITRSMSDLAGEALSLANLGSTYYSSRQYQLAIDFYQQSLSIAREIDARVRVAEALNGLGNVYKATGQYRQSLEFFQESIDIDREINYRRGEGWSLTNMADAYSSLGQYQRAIELHQQVLDIRKELGDRRGEANSLNSLGSTYDSLGQYQQAIERYERSLTIFQAESDRRGEASALRSLGGTYKSLGQYQQAIELYQQCLEIWQELGDRRGEATAFVDLGDVHVCLLQYQAATEFYQQALDIDREIDNRQGESTVLGGLGDMSRQLSSINKL
jgi:tetratricopeptide (TPR) repeat protein